MDHLIVIKTLCIGLTILLNHCVSQQVHHEQVDAGRLSLPELPRKLRLSERVTDMKGHGDQDFTLHKRHSAVRSGDDPSSESRGTAASTWMETTEAIDGRETSELFTMDYAPVRRRRPIHNKSSPSAAAAP